MFGTPQKLQGDLQQLTEHNEFTDLTTYLFSELQDWLLRASVTPSNGFGSVALFVTPQAIIGQSGGSFLGFCRRSCCQKQRL